MNNTLRTLTSMLLLAAIAGCGNPEDTTREQAESSTDLPEGSDTTLAQERNDLAPVAAEDDGTVAPPNAANADKSGPTNSAAAFDPRNSTFSLDGRNVTLTNGQSQAPAAPGSASSVTTRYLGMAARGDLTGDDKEDLAYIVTRDGGGSGRYYYVVAAITGANGYKTTNAFLIGDRIVPQSLRIASNELQVNFLGRGRGEPMTAPPSRPSVLLLKVSPGGVLEGLMK